MVESQRTELSPDGAEWRDVLGYEGRYRVDDYGGVWSFVDFRGRPQAEPHRLKPRPDRAGRLRVGLYDGRGGQRTVFVHRLVLGAFIGPCPIGMEGCHRNDDPTNNRLSNLRWDTPKANGADRVRNGRQARGERQGSARLREADILTIHAALAAGVTKAALARRHGVSRGAIHYIAVGKNWRHVPTAASRPVA